MSFSIRAYAPSDLPILQTIRAAAFAPVFASFRSIVGPEIAALGLGTSEQEQTDLLDSIAKPGSGHGLAIAETHGVIAGFVSWKPNIAPGIGEITLNAVHPDHGGKGIGTALYDHALATLKSAGMQLATVGTGGDASHAPARRAYEKAGFSIGLPSVYLYRRL
jgi:ribosomal protein S18 acetylase RimI-like enzyme